MSLQNFNSKMKSSQQGFTLVELLVYIGVSAIVVMIAGQVWFQFTKSSKKTSNRMVNYQDIEQVLYYLTEDISRMGSKANTENSAVTMTNEVFMSATDSSSFGFVNGSDTLDQLMFKAAVFSDDSSIYLGYDSVSYSVNNKQLIRQAVRVDSGGTVGASESTVMIDSVVAFDIQFGVYSSEGSANSSLGSITAMTDNQLASVNLSGGTSASFATSGNYAQITNLDYGSAIEGDSTAIAITNVGDASSRRVWDDNANVGIQAGRTYRVSFSTLVDQEFIDNFDIVADSMYLVIRRAFGSWDNLAGVPKYYFYPGQPNVVAEREFTFTSSVDLDEPSVYIMFDLENDLGAGVFSLGPIEIEEMDTGTYRFVSEFTSPDSVQNKLSVRSMKLRLRMNHNSSMDGMSESYNLRKFIQLPNNGVK